ncbi:hypothetical protein BJ322DRAFT_1070387 [Thelephora terrestris]|uniref:Uncharacterized protein n=1 Tax=Thelephora terrestris TaxID=56493 RepID=A0A9P6HB97_9AGAM|nr:hypothetical protein BJ322DRAFT_1070387 [Thelephora terrestris]
MMACRLMLSLRRSATESTGLWSLSCPSRAISTDMDLEFRSSPAIDALSLPRTDGEAVELAESVPELRSER